MHWITILLIIIVVLYFFKQIEFFSSTGIPVDDYSSCMVNCDDYENRPIEDCVIECDNQYPSPPSNEDDNNTKYFDCFNDCPSIPSSDVGTTGISSIYNCLLENTPSDQQSVYQECMNQVNLNLNLSDGQKQDILNCFASKNSTVYNQCMDMITSSDPGSLAKEPTCVSACNSKYPDPNNS